MTSIDADSLESQVVKVDAVDENPLTLSWILRHPLVGAAAVSSAGAGLVHAAASGTHSGQRVAAIIFAVTAALQVAWAFYYLAHPGRRAAIIGFGLNGTFAAVWLASRTVGLPAPEELAGVEHATLQDGIAALLGLTAAVCSAIAAWKTDLVEHHRAGSIVTACAVSVVVVFASIAGISASHGHGVMPGMNLGSTGTQTTSAGAMPGTDMSGMNMTSGPTAAPHSGSTMMDHSNMPGMDMSGMDMSGMSGNSMSGMDMSSTTSTTALQLPAGSSLNTTDVGYAQGVVASRRQQLRMARLAVTNSRNPEVVLAAMGMAAEPAPSIARLDESLRSVNQPAPDPSFVSGMAAATPAMMTNGLLSEAEMVQLENSFGRTFDLLYLALMVRQKNGVIGMSERAYDSGTNSEIRVIASELISSYTAQQRAFVALSKVVREQV